MIIKIVLISCLLITNSYSAEDDRNEEEKDNEEIVKTEVRIGDFFFILTLFNILFLYLIFSFKK